MLRAQVYCSLLFSPPQVKLVKVGSSSSSWLIQYRSAQRLPKEVSVKALKDGAGGETSGFSGQSWDPESEIEVPFEQRPVNEYSSLKDGVLYSWGELGPGPFLLRLGGLWLVTFTTLGLPIAAASFNPSRDPLRFALAAGTRTLFVVSLIVLRIYLPWIQFYQSRIPENIYYYRFPGRYVWIARKQMQGLKFHIEALNSGIGWSYVGDRLLSAIIPYEESGWYDGQMWVKPPEVLARDRLLGSYKVKPVIKLLKQTLVGTGALLVTGVLLFIFATPVEDFIHTTFGTKQDPSSVSASKISSRLNISKEELLKLPTDVKANDDLTAAAADGRPVYCRDRFYRALAGGQYCKWEDLLK